MLTRYNERVRKKPCFKISLSLFLVLFQCTTGNHHVNMTSVFGITGKGFDRGLLTTNGDSEPTVPFPIKQNIRGTGHFVSDDKLKSHCIKSSACQTLTRSTCLGATLPYKLTSFALVNGTSLDDIEGKLSVWTSLKQVPRCWAVVQAFLCAVYLPKCDSNGLVLPPRELCRITRGPCRVLELSGGWPDFLKCSNDHLFPTDCKHDIKEIKFNTSASCQPPLVESDQQSNWYHAVDGCGVQCFNPLVSSEQHKQIHSFIGIIGSICLASNIFAVLTFLIDWRNSRRYPAVIIFYINGCYMMACIGWLSQFTPEARRDIVCHRDGTARKAQPSSGETLSCVTVFILIYYFTMAAAIWFVLLAFAWDVSFRSVGIPRKVVESKSSYFHLAAWCIPFIMTIAIMAMKEIDSDSVYGICFVSYENKLIRILFHLVPFTISWLGGTFFLTRGLITLLKVKFGSSNVMSHHVKSRIKNMVVRLGLFILFISSAVVGTLICHIFEYLQKGELELSLQQYIVCLTVHSKDEDKLPCKVKQQPNLLLVHLQLLAMFGSGLMMSSWLWTSASLCAWRRFLYRVCNQPTNEPIKLKRHKMIAQAFAHRDNFSQGQMTLSYDSTHEDPVGMNLEINSVASRAPSSTWAAALPKFLLRRGALAGSGALGLRRYSSTSDISQCPIPLVPLTGRRHSMDSQNSMQISEQDWIATAQRHVQELARQRRRKTRKERERFIRGSKRISPWLLFGRRGSDTSQQSSVNAAERGFLKPTKVTKATSTGDLGQQEQLYYRPPTTLVFPVARQMLQRHPIILPPFTHGMADNDQRVGKDGNPLITPNPIGRSKTTLPRVNGYALPAQVLPIGQGYIGGTPVPSWIPFGQIPYNYPTYVGLAALMPDHEPIIPLNPMPDSCSEAEFFPIVMSDSDFTDTGFKSPIEEQLLNVKIVQERIKAIVGQTSPTPNNHSYLSNEITCNNPNHVNISNKNWVNKKNSSLISDDSYPAQLEIPKILNNSSDCKASYLSISVPVQRHNSASSLHRLTANKRQNSESTIVESKSKSSSSLIDKESHLNSARSLCFTPEFCQKLQTEDDNTELHILNNRAAFKTVSKESSNEENNKLLSDAAER